MVRLLAALLRKPRTGALSAGLLAAATIGAGQPVCAADVTPAQAAALEIELRAGIASVLGPTVKLSDHPILITAAGDRFDVVVPTSSEALDGTGRARVTATARPGTDGTWAIENIKVTSPLRFTYDMPVPSDRGKGPAASVPVVSTVNVEGQDGRIAWDPSFATPSTWTTSTTGITIHTEAKTLSQETKLGPSNSVTTLRPVGSDRSDLLLDGTFQDYTIDSLMNDVPVRIGIQRIRVTSALNALSRSRALTMVPALTGMVLTSIAPPSGQPAAPTPKFAPERIHAVLASLQDFASEFRLDETIDGFAVKFQEQAVGIERMRVGLFAKSDAGMLQAGMDLGVEGLALPNLPLGEMSTLIPRKIALRPVISGVGVAELMRLASAAADGREAAPADIAALFSHGGIAAALESLTIDLGGAAFSGQGKVTATGPSPELVTATAQFTADHFDDLMQKLSAVPELAQILPIIVFAKGIGRSVNDRLVWDVSYKGGKLLVNNVDLTAMAGAAAPAGPPSHSTGRSGTEGAPKSAAPRPPNQRPAPNPGK